MEQNMTEMEDKPKTSDVDDIRKILFGDQIVQIEERFSALEKSITQLRAENRNLRQALEAEVTMRERSTEELKRLQQSFEEATKNLQRNRDDALKDDLGTQIDLLHTMQQTLEKHRNALIGPSE